MDSGALIAAERDDRNFWADWKLAVRDGARFRLPSVVVTQVWRGGNNPQVSRVMKACQPVHIDGEWAKRAGVLLGEARASDAVDALVVAVAAHHGDEIWCSDPTDLRALAHAASRGSGMAVKSY